MKSSQAQVAALIRAELKRHGIAGRVTSASGSMTTSCSVKLFDPMPGTFDAVESFCAKFRRGRFDGMTDCYNYTNKRDDIPQVKFMFVESQFSYELRQAAWDYIRVLHVGFDGAPAGINAACDSRWSHTIMGLYADTIVWRVLSGKLGHFWRSRKPRRRLELARAA